MWADCGPNGVCSPSTNICGWQIQGWWCHDPTTDECFSDTECRGGAEGCVHVDGAGWRCVLLPVCD